MNEISQEVIKYPFSDEKVQLVLLERLRSCIGADYSSDPDALCLNKTRMNLRKLALDWTQGTIPPDSTTQPKDVFWLHGMAGSGKTTVANTIAQAIDKGDYLLSCFFCKKTDPKLSDPRRVLPSLADSFSTLYPSYREAIVDFLTSPRGSRLPTAGILEQFEILFGEPISASKVANPFRPHVVVVDALDECGTAKQQEELAHALVNLSQTAPWLKVFVTSRDEPRIRGIFSETPNCFAYDINGDETTGADIEVYVKTRNAELQLDLSPVQIRQLVEQASGLFIWCDTLFKFLDTSMVKKGVIRPFLVDKDNKNTREPLENLYTLYSGIVDKSINANNRADQKLLKAILSVIFITSSTRPLTAKGISDFLRRDEEFSSVTEDPVRNIVRSLHAVLHVDEQDVIHMYHQSFSDYLEQTFQDGKSWKTLQDMHKFMFRACIDSLLATDGGLKFNICKIEEPVLTADIMGPGLEKRLSDYVSDLLSYSSSFWMAHFSQSGCKPAEVETTVSKLLCKVELLFWIELSSLQKTIGRTVEILEDCASFFKVRGQ